MGASGYKAIKDSLRQLYLGDPRPWLVEIRSGVRETLHAVYWRQPSESFLAAAF
ncbi:MAG TPA: hypothetical protein VL486_10225 [Verrucomicrobiae bacterium]|nr:hypothetical protein [Verrucomicrobiae bacterium]